MKQEIIKVAKSLENNTINEERAKKMLLLLFGINGSSQPLDLSNVQQLLKEISLESFLAAGGNSSDWKSWWAIRNKIRLNNLK